MHKGGSFLPWIRLRLPHLSIFQRIAIGNALIIAIGAIGGTLLTRHLTDRAADLSLIVFFATIGTFLSVLTNTYIISKALRPVKELRQLVDRVQAGNTRLDIISLHNSDPDISRLAQTLNSLVTQLAERNQQLRALSERAIDAQEEERKNIARSLHDDTGQALSMLIINLERLENRLPQDEVELIGKLSATRQLASGTLVELRKIISGLRPTILDDLGLVPAIRWYARSVLEVHGIKTRLCIPEEPVELSSHLATTLFRITQEAINNIMRHSHAQEAEISLVLRGNQVCLQVQDNGQGFNPAQVAEEAVNKQHLGLLGIQERAELVGGEIAIESVPGKGARLQVCVPLPREVEHHEDENSNTVSRRPHHSPRWDPLPPGR